MSTPPRHTPATATPGVALRERHYCHRHQPASAPAGFMAWLVEGPRRSGVVLGGAMVALTAVVVGGAATGMDWVLALSAALFAGAELECVAFAHCHLAWGYGRTDQLRAFLWLGYGGGALAVAASVAAVVLGVT